MKYSIIIPVYNRPEEVRELLESLCKQTYSNFEVLIIEDGSTNKCDEVVAEFEDKLEIYYYFKENSGQGFSRNYGFERANGDYFIIFDSDCIIPFEYLEIVNNQIQKRKLDAFGGPDASHESFTPTQKAISYAMTSLLSTGGIRGHKKAAEKFRPRSFNMGISRQVYEETNGFIITRMGEDIELSIRIEQKHHFKTGLIPEAFVYHKRRTDFKQFYKQLYFFGRARINVGRFFKKEIKFVHYFPACFIFFCSSLLITPFISPSLALIQVLILFLYALTAFVEASNRYRSVKIGFLGMAAVFIQLTAYGIGFMTELFKK